MSQNVKRCQKVLATSHGPWPVPYRETLLSRSPNSTNEDFEMISLAFHACIILHPVSDTTCALTSLHHTGHAATMLLVEDFIALLPLCPPLYVRSLLSQQCTQQCLSNERQKASVETNIESNKRIQKVAFVPSNSWLKSPSKALVSPRNSLYTSWPHSGLACHLLP